VEHVFRTEHDGRVTDLGVLPGGGGSFSTWISPNGLIAGDSGNGQLDPLIPSYPVGHALLWQKGGITDLGVSEGGYESQANAVNSRGEVVGIFTNTTPDADSMYYGLGYEAKAFFWKNGVMQDLGTLGGPDSQALFINEPGQVVGWSYVNSGPEDICGQNNYLTLATNSFIWDKEKGMRDLGTLGGTCTTATALNNGGQIVGHSMTPGDQFEHAFLWEHGSIHDLGNSLGGNSAGAFAVNDAGEAVGFASLAGDAIFHAALWTHIGESTDLGVPPNAICSYARSINARRQVVGVASSDCANDNIPFLWDSGSIFDLNALIPAGSSLTLHFAVNINDRGEIAGFGSDAAGNQHAFLLVPCGEGDDGCGDDAVAAAPVPSAVRESSGQMPPAHLGQRMNRGRRGLTIGPRN